MGRLEELIPELVSSFVQVASERPSAHSSLTCGTGAGSWLSHWVVQCTECTVSCILHGCLYSALATVFPIWVPANGQKRSHRTSFFLSSRSARIRVTCTRKATPARAVHR